MNCDNFECRWGDVEICEPCVLQVVEVTFGQSVPEVHR